MFIKCNGMTEGFGDVVVRREWKDSRNDGSDGGNCIPYSDEIDGDSSGEGTFICSTIGVKKKKPVK